MQYAKNPPGRYGYYWSGPSDHRTTEICSKIKARTPAAGFDSPKELSKAVMEEAQKYYDAKGYKTTVREWLPHPNCRHTIHIIKEAEDMSEIKGLEEDLKKMLRPYKVVVSAPYVSYIEYGTDPHPVNKKGIQNLKEWARLKLSLSEKEAESAAYVIVNNVRMKLQSCGHSCSPPPISKG